MITASPRCRPPALCLVGVDERHVDDVLGDEPDLHLVGADDVADQQIVGAVVAALRAPAAPWCALP